MIRKTKFTNSELNQFWIEMSPLLNTDTELKVFFKLLKEIDILINFIEKNYEEFNVKISENVFNKHFDNFFKKVSIYNSFNSFLLKKIKKLFRKLLFKYIKGSKYFYYGLTKPKGYPGDFKIIEAIYNNKISSTKGLDNLLDAYFMRDSYVQVVRDRKTWTREYLKKYISKSSKNEIRILNLACGSCRDIRELESDFHPQKKQKVQFDFIDQDLETINWSKKRLKNKESFVHYFKRSDVLKYVLSFSKNYQRKSYDLIYSIGLIDYLPDSYLGPMIKNSLKLLKPQGVLLLAHKNSRKVYAAVADWMCDWRFIPRTKEEVRKLICKNVLDKKQIKFYQGNNSLVFYYIIK